MASVRRFEDALRQGTVGVSSPAGEGPGPRTCRRVLAWLQADPAETLLDLGCSSGEMLRCASNLGLDPTGLEFSPEAAAVAQKFAPAAVVFIGSLNELPFESANFKYLTCLGAPANLVDPRLDLAEIFRVIKPGGRACLVLNLEPSAEAGEEYLVIEPASLPAATTFSGWAEQLSAVGFNLLDAWPEPFLWSPRGFPRWGGGAGGRWLKRRFWEWLPDWRRLPIVFLAEKPRTLNRATVI